jgi:hypothetical protein
MTTHLLTLSDEETRELRFQLRSLRYALATSVAEVALCRLPSAFDAASLSLLRGRLASLDSLVNDDIRSHAQRALALLDPGTLAEALATSISMAPVSAQDARAPFTQQIDNLAAALTGAAELVAAISDAESPLAALDDVRRIVAILNDLAAPAVRTALTLAVAFHRAADSSAAAEDDRANELAEPLRELPHVEARALTLCPHCGAHLGAGDRTFNGSYCEACRSRFYLPR